MAVRTFLLCLALLSAAGAGPGEADSAKDPRKDPKEDPAFVEGVNGAIDKGVAWLLKKQSSGGRFPAFEDRRGAIYPLGMHALATLAVVKSGWPLDSPQVIGAFSKLDTIYQRNRNAMKTYEVGLVLMVLDAKYTTPKGKKKKRRRKKKKKPKLSESDRKMATDLVRWLQRQQRPGGLWRYPEGGQDLSNTQYAALGLWSAHRIGIEVNKGVVRRMLEATLERQQPGGVRVPFIVDPKAPKGRSITTIKARGWRYLPKEEIKRSDGSIKTIVYPYSGSMTSAGVALLAIGRDILGEKDSWLTKARDRRIRTAMWEGLAWIQNNWELRDNPGQPGNWPFYWIYGLERCARLSGVEYIGRHDWYHEGATRLVHDQKPDGSWPKTQRMRPKNNQNVRWWSDQVDTCFALLFLTRSTPEIVTQPPAITGGG